MTKLEELARKIANDADLLGSAGSSRIQAQLETALKPLLDAVDAVAKHTAPYDRSLNWKQVDQEIAVLREQLSQWRSRP